MSGYGAAVVVALSICLWAGDAGASGAESSGEVSGDSGTAEGDSPTTPAAAEIYGWFGGYVGTGMFPDSIDFGPSYGFTLGRFRQQGPGFLGVELVLGPTPTTIPPPSLVPWYWPKVAFHGGAMHPRGPGRPFVAFLAQFEFGSMLSLDVVLPLPMPAGRVGCSVGFVIVPPTTANGDRGKGFRLAVEPALLANPLGPTPLGFIVELKLAGVFVPRSAR